MEPQWLAIVGWIALALGFASALTILADELVLGHRRQMWVMNLVHPITALYAGPLWLWAYLTRGGERSRFRETAEAVSHCGAGCTLGDIGGEWILWALGMPTLGASGAYGPEVIADFVLAWTFGVAFQYFTIVPMRDDVSRLRGIWLAARADTLSILAFQLGLFGWMAISHFVLFDPPLAVDTSGHWLMMQIGMLLGFGTAWPVNRWLVDHGWKERMGG